MSLTLRNALPSPHQKERVVQRMFSSIARYYDLNNTLLSWGLHHRWKKKAVQCVGLCPGDVVLDMGAGTADLARLAARLIGTQGLVMALDLNEPMLRIGREKLKPFPHAACLLANGESLPVRDQSVDAVLTGFCLRNVTDREGALNEIFRVLKPNGRMVCLEFSRPTHRFFRAIYDFYSFFVLPGLGTLISSDQTGVYRYLPESIRAFPNQDQFLEQLQGIGFEEVSYLNCAYGIVAIHTGRKPLDSAGSSLTHSSPNILPTGRGALLPPPAGEG